jgi:uncharacterized protein
MTAPPAPSHEVRTVPVTTDLDGAEISVVAHTIRGRNRGPTLALLAGAGAGEWQSTLAVRTVAGALERSSFAGRVVAVPVADPLAFATVGSEVGPLGRQSGWPSEASVPGQVRDTVTRMLADADAVVELRCGTWGTTAVGVASPILPDAAGGAGLAHALAEAYGAAVSLRTPDLRTPQGAPWFTAALAGRGVPVLSALVGGSGFTAAVEQAWIDQASAGIMRVMRALGMVSDAPQAARDSRTEAGRWQRISPRVAGFLEPARAAEQLVGARVEAGALLGLVRSPYSFDVVAELRSPSAGIVVLAASAQPIRPGEPAFAVAEA